MTLLWYWFFQSPLGAGDLKVSKSLKDFGALTIDCGNKKGCINIRMKDFLNLNGRALDSLLPRASPARRRTGFLVLTSDGDYSVEVAHLKALRFSVAVIAQDSAVRQTFLAQGSNASLQWKQMVREASTRQPGGGLLLDSRTTAESKGAKGSDEDCDDEQTAEPSSSAGTRTTDLREGQQLARGAQAKRQKTDAKMCRVTSTEFQGVQAGQKKRRSAATERQQLEEDRMLVAATVGGGPAAEASTEPLVPEGAFAAVGEGVFVAVGEGARPFAAASV
uniref:Uncharacterized protein n=1 Tax=Chromera velia CCMP2878 TaxID=1169474 RepID=A0A0G4HVH4_9ALVE|eukprot:Cvel_8804.t1-p1 / transcript=Cvel_8804.t1 / gene=Cvel_8804 / organism=Chromera_velia_CCMP2878 / gene_product=hypothetical protein / transcript_product=hypothetical protein / location=Cvel_scaffold493:44538-46176(-) / protein_length=276 / sequence_SO=supercontig / SO=protein_coding / is_pseudo=false